LVTNGNNAGLVIDRQSATLGQSDSSSSCKGVEGVNWLGRRGSVGPTPFTGPGGGSPPSTTASKLVFGAHLVFAPTCTALKAGSSSLDRRASYSCSKVRDYVAAEFTADGPDGPHIQAVTP